jgi:transmembrane sensor
MSAFETGGAAGPVDGEALDWALRMNEPDAGWDAFTAWLEMDADHAERYDRAVAALTAATESVVLSTPTVPAAANDVEDLDAFPQAGRSSRRAWARSAVAAALIGALGLGLWQERDQTYTVATAAGERRIVALADGSSIVLAGGSRVRLDRAQQRSATVEAGEALFQVRHNASKPFRVRVRDLALTDLGTVFGVRLLGSRTYVAVAEGAVLVDPEGAAVRLDPGQGVITDGKTIRRTRQDVAEVGSWRDGRLAYDNATMGDVAEDLSRQLGWRITATPAVAKRVFNGTLETSTFRNDPALLGALLGVRVRQDGSGWTLDAPR